MIEQYSTVQIATIIVWFLKSHNDVDNTLPIAHQTFSGVSGRLRYMWCFASQIAQCLMDISKSHNYRPEISGL